MKFDPYIYGFQKEVKQIEQNLFKKSADLVK